MLNRIGSRCPLPCKLLSGYLSVVGLSAQALKFAANVLIRHLDDGVGPAQAGLLARRILGPRKGSGSPHAAGDQQRRRGGRVYVRWAQNKEYE